MIKNMLIAAMAAGYVLRCPWFADCDIPTKTVMWVSFSLCLLFFCLFFEEKHEKWLKKRKRAMQLREKIIRLSNMGGIGHEDERKRVVTSRR